MFVFEKNSGSGIIATHSFSKNVKLVLSNSPGKKSVFEKPRFYDRSVSTVGLFEEISYAFKFLRHKVNAANFNLRVNDFLASSQL